jgi:hypothetical protein
LGGKNFFKLDRFTEMPLVKKKRSQIFHCDMGVVLKKKIRRQIPKPLQQESQTQKPLHNRVVKVMIRRHSRESRHC